MEKRIYKANERGSANYGWLNTRLSFSFANYFDRNKMNFGVLRVLNDDKIAPGTGFDEHPHDNMEIITLVTKGELTHKDSLGHSSVIKPGDVQVMSAGSGIYHSEFNLSEETLELFQIWIFPDRENVVPRYAQKNFSKDQFLNNFKTIVGPNDGENELWIHQNAWISVLQSENAALFDYEIKAGKNAVYIFVESGSITIEGEVLNKRDAIGISNSQSITIETEGPAKVFVFDIPLIAIDS